MLFDARESVEVRAGCVIATLLTVNAVAAPNAGVVRLGEVERTMSPEPVTVFPRAVTVPVDGSVRFVVPVAVKVTAKAPRVVKECAVLKDPPVEKLPPVENVPDVLKAPPVEKVEPLDSESVAVEAGDVIETLLKVVLAVLPTTCSREDGEAVPIPSRLLALSQNKFALFWL